MSDVCFGGGHTSHQRVQKLKNAFRYPIFMLKFRVRSEAELQASLRRKFHGFFSLRAADYLHRKNGSLDETFRIFLRENCGGFDPEEVWLLTMPRIFGYAFNPVSFWLCRRNGKLEAALCEVNNTFGERHFYWVKAAGDEFREWNTAAKNFHVSPFLPVEGFYQFFFRDSQARTRIDVNYHDSSGKLELATCIELEHAPLENISFIRTMARYGWLTVLVVARIHYQAIKLWWKGAKFHAKPVPKPQGVTL